VLSVARLRQRQRLVVLLLILGVLVVVLIVGNGGSNDPVVTSGISLEQPLTAAQRAAVTIVLRRITPPAGFHRYARLSVLRSGKGPSVPCTPTTGVCYASESLLEPLTVTRVRALIARFGVHVQRVVGCPADSPPVVGALSARVAEGSFSDYHLGVMITLVRAPHPKERSSTQVMFFGGRRE
jgi:hypothetical protein